MAEMVRFRTKNLAIPSASHALTTNYRLSLAQLRGCAREYGKPLLPKALRVLNLGLTAF